MKSVCEKKPTKFNKSHVCGSEQKKKQKNRDLSVKKYSTKGSNKVVVEFL